MSSYSLEQALKEEGFSSLEDLSNSARPPRPATEEDLKYLVPLFWQENIRKQTFKKLVDQLNLTRGGQRILHKAVRDCESLPLNDYVAKFHFQKKLELWQEEDIDISQPLFDCGYWGDQTTFKSEISRLWHYGVKGIRDAVKVYELLPHVWVKGRSLESPFQISFHQLVLVATNPSYKNLPIWAKAQIIRGRHASSRPGDVWRTMMPALKAWKWDNTLPKRIARRLGEMPPRYRALGAIAWYICQNKDTDFWQEFRALCQNKDTAIPALLFGQKYGDWGYPYVCNGYTRNRALETLWGLPHKLLDGELPPTSSEISEKVAVNISQKYGRGSAAVCQYLFGCGGKRVQKLFKGSTPCQRKWAIALAFGKEDLVQKYLGLPSVPYQEEAIGFLKSLGEKPALRMVQTTKMTIRSKTQEVTADYVRDTGYLYSQLHNAGVNPDLGRVRCWYSTHELLAKEYVRILPDFELRLNPDFTPLDGLRSIDRVWELEIPKHQHQLKRYGEILQHCVGGYGSWINTGRSVIIGVYNFNELKYTLEFIKEGDRYSCNQFYGSRNSHPCESDREFVLAMFKQAKLI